MKRRFLSDHSTRYLGGSYKVSFTVTCCLFFSPTETRHRFPHFTDVLLISLWFRWLLDFGILWVIFSKQNTLGSNGGLVRPR